MPLVQIYKSLRLSIDDVDLSDYRKRQTAIIFAIYLLEKVYYAEEEFLAWEDIFLIRFGGVRDEYVRNSYSLLNAISTLYGAYDLASLRERNIHDYILLLENSYENTCSI